jgi:hypothetical protein
LISLEISRPGPIRGGLMICGSRCHQANQVDSLLDTAQ